MIVTNDKQRGVGLIEVLVSLVILAVGLLSVATLHTSIIGNSNDNKAKNEAIIIAQSRIEALRNFSNGINTTDEFEAAFVVVDKGNSTNITGINAAFTRTESIADANSAKSITVYVKWNDNHSDAQEVSIDSSIAWQKPRSVGDLSSEASEPLIPSATGRARLGDGTLTLAELNAAITTGAAKATDDGMFLYDSLDGQYRLVDKDRTIVLTLIDACDLAGGNCTDFVKISGRVYIDNATQSSLTTGDVFIQASDAAFCQQYYLDSDGNAQELLPVANSDMKTPNNDYTYYNYTCYLGGGWHGNIGIILSGGITQKDKVCQGDPTSLDAFADPVIAARRVYRGMLHKEDGNGDIIVDANQQPIYYSIGVADALVLPAAGDAGHDFIISSLNINDTEGFKCKSEGIMVRDDSYYSRADLEYNTPPGTTPGKLFEGIPTDFFCLNQNADYIDSFDDTVFSMDASCPFDPSDPPSIRHVISGKVLVNTDLSIDSDIAAITVNTSDGSGNCVIAAFTKPSSTQYSLSYKCDVYDWGTGWDGYIQLNTDYSIMACDHYREAYNTITNDISAGDNICNIGDVLTVTGAVVVNGTKVLTSATTDDNGGQCVVASDGASYACNSDLLATGVQWSGRLTFQTNGSKLCISDPVLPVGSVGTFAIVDGASSTAWIDLMNVDKGNLVLALEVIQNNGNCP
ncbi:type IV pilus modification PilV family protein [Colwellia sp. 12G3]|uniref:type IV pilus modification PilV family protein n=1 Tax=Colwellia sp. 12G3 TaxID=2058299 RepID=UPI0012FEAE02|nr:prepilin-type N-terminal cleavage/methylation domain-containing protein [Colwellia sp. 12G3]